MGGLVHLAHLLWTHLLDQADYGRFAILEGVVFGFAVATVTLAPQQYVLVYVHKKERSELAGDLGGVLGLAFIAGVLATLAILVLPDSFFVLGVEAIPRWAIAGVIVAATFDARGSLVGLRRRDPTLHRDRTLLLARMDLGSALGRARAGSSGRRSRRNLGLVSARLAGTPAVARLPARAPSILPPDDSRGACLRGLSKR